MKSSRRTLLTALPVFFAFSRAFAAPADADAAATISAFYTTLLSVMKKAKTENFEQRFHELEPAITKAFDLAMMTRIAVGPKWSAFSQDQRQKLIEAFGRYTVASYTRNFDSYSGQRFEVSPKPVANPSGVIVESHLIPSSGDSIAFNYLMHETGGKWQIIDVYLKGTISQLAVRRSEFSDVLARSGAEGLVRVLTQKAQALQTG